METTSEFRADELARSLLVFDNEDSEGQEQADVLFNTLYDDEPTESTFVDQWADVESNSGTDTEASTGGDGVRPHSSARSFGSASTIQRQQNPFGSHALIRNTAPSLMQNSSASTTRTRMKVEGGRPAHPKRISANLDSDDELIMKKKQQGYSDKKVSEFLVAEGRIKYDRKTINSRYLRIRRAMQARQDELLDEELTDWHEGEDEALLQAHALAVAQVNDEIVKLRERLFDHTARHLHHILPSSNYSGKACRERFANLIDDNAAIPPELCDNPTERAELRAARVLEVLARKEAEKAALEAYNEKVRLREKESRARATNRKRAVAERKIKTAEERTKRDLALAEKRKIKEDKLKKKRLEKIQKAEEQAKQFEERKARMQAAQKDKNAEGNHKNANADSQRKTAQKGSRRAKQTNAEVAAAAIETGTEASAVPLTAHVADGTVRTHVQSGLPTNKTSTDKKARSASSLPQQPKVNVTLASAVDPSTPKKRSTAMPPPPGPPQVQSTSTSTSPVSDPRERLTAGELKTELRARGLSMQGKKEDLVLRLSQNDFGKTIDKLKHKLRTRNLPVTGTKAQLVHRLAKADAAQSAWGRKQKLSSVQDRQAVMSSSTGDSPSTAEKACPSKRPSSVSPTDAHTKRARTSYPVTEGTIARNTEDTPANTPVAESFINASSTQTDTAEDRPERGDAEMIG